MCIHQLYNKPDGNKNILGIDPNNINLEEVDLEFIVTAVYSLVDDLYQSVVPWQIQRRRGPSPALSDSEIITISLVMGNVDVFLHKILKMEVTVGKYFYWKYFCNIRDPPKPKNLVQPRGLADQLFCRFLDF